MAKTMLIALALIAVVNTGAAQEPTAEDGLGPYQFGMSSADARATAPNAEWVQRDQDGRVVLTGGPRVAIGGRLDASLVFMDDQLRRIVLAGVTSTACPDAVSAIVEMLEPRYGAFSSAAPQSLEQGALRQTVRTPAGSEIRVRGIDGRGASVSARYGAVYVVVQGRPERRSRCRLILTLGPQTDWQRFEPTEGPTLAQLDAAPRLADPLWSSRPNAYSFTRNYPQGALERAQDGVAMLDCLVVADGRLSCRVAEETPAGEGFAAAALGIARDFRVERGEDGAPALGRRVRVPIRFNAE
ncbi:MAG: energy transducer TonB [Phycisphaerales bacterium]|nr:energy transducer TonB [Hyphomonadaceae bacterium]